MFKSKYSKPILFFIFYCIFIIGLSVALSLSIPHQDLTYLIPIRDMGIETGLIFIVIMPFSSIVGMLIGGYIFAPFFLYLHKKIFGSKVEYGIYRKQYKDFKFLVEGLFTSLMTINISLLLTTPLIISVSIGSDPNSFIDDLTTFLALLMIAVGIASTLFATTWFLMDSGILYSNLKRAEKSHKPIEIRSVGRWYGQFLKGYAGISVVFSYIEFMELFIPQLANDLSIPLFIVLLVVFVPFPLIVVLPLIPALIILDLLKEKRIKFIKERASKIGISSNAEVTFELKN
ncbi:MAG: hypothetical protein KGD67_04315 [Candidatus Lokiarchaeota archaeon]|nr:hypothetical protein [Candidatus Lokiarchaeota archaeon]